MIIDMNNLMRDAFENRFHIRDHVICCLHAKQRITERLFLLTNGSTQGIQQVVQRVRALKNLGRFGISVKEHQNATSFSSLRVSMLTGEQCNRKHFEAIIGDDASPWYW